jgi:hypothetical protein
MDTSQVIQNPLNPPVHRATSMMLSKRSNTPKDQACPPRRPHTERLRLAVARGMSVNSSTPPRTELPPWSRRPHHDKQRSRQGDNWAPLCDARLAWKALRRECRQRRPHSSAVPSTESHRSNRSRETPTPLAARVCRRADLTRSPGPGAGGARRARSRCAFGAERLR